MFWHKKQDSPISQFDFLGLDQACLGIVFTGRPGSGKSTIMRMLIRNLADRGVKFCVAAVKPDESQLMKSVLPDAEIISPDTHTINPLTFELQRSGGSARNLAALHDDLSEVLTRADSSRQEPFWKVGANDTMTHALSLCHLVLGDDATYQHAYEIVMSAPASLEQAKSDSFRETACGHFINELGKADPILAQPYADFFLKRFPASGEKASGAFRMQALGTIQPLIEGRIKDLTCGKSTITPDEMLNKNTILAMDTLTYGKGGLAMNLLISWLLMEALLRRKGDFGFFGLCLDEYHQLCHAERDTQAQAIGRSQKFISIKAFQSLSVLETALGGGVEAQTQAKALYGLPVNKFMMNSNDHFTNEFNSMVIGQEKQMFFGAGQRADSQLEWYDVLGVGARMDFNFSQNWHYRVPPTDFMKLRTGGKENDYIVDCIYHRGFDDFYRLSFTQEFY